MEYEPLPRRRDFQSLHLKAAWSSSHGFTYLFNLALQVIHTRFRLNRQLVLLAVHGLYADAYFLNRGRVGHLNVRGATSPEDAQDWQLLSEQLLLDKLSNLGVALLSFIHF